MKVCDKCGKKDDGTKSVVGTVGVEISGYHWSHTGKSWHWNKDLCKPCTAKLQDAIDKLINQSE